MEAEQSFLSIYTKARVEKGRGEKERGKVQVRIVQTDAHIPWGSAVLGHRGSSSVGCVRPTVLLLLDVSYLCVFGEDKLPGLPAIGLRGAGLSGTARGV